MRSSTEAPNQPTSTSTPVTASPEERIFRLSQLLPQLLQPTARTLLPAHPDGPVSAIAELSFTLSQPPKAKKEKIFRPSSVPPTAASAVEEEEGIEGSSLDDVLGRGRTLSLVAVAHGHRPSLRILDVSQTHLNPSQ